MTADRLLSKYYRKVLKIADVKLAFYIRNDYLMNLMDAKFSEHII